MQSPATAPRAIDSGMFTKLITSTELPRARPVNVVNSTITKTSSTEAPARIICGIFFFVPYPSSISFIIPGTTTAGDTAPTTAPRIAASSTVIPSNGGASNNIPRTSKVAGRKHIRIAGLPTFFRSSADNFNPALRNIMISAIFLISAEIFNTLESMRFSTEGPMRIPASNMPSRPGSPDFLHRKPRKSPKNKI